jgi:hypothetical protein
MGVGGMLTRTSWPLEKLAEAMDEYIQRTDQEVEERLALVNRVRRARRQLELQMWKTSPLFCRPR